MVKKTTDNSLGKALKNNTQSKIQSLRGVRKDDQTEFVNRNRTNVTEEEKEIDLKSSVHQNHMDDYFDHQEIEEFENKLDFDENDFKTQFKKFNKENSKTMPINPFWDYVNAEDYSKEDVKKIEKFTYFEWRKAMEKIKKEQNRPVIPYEKNLNVWKQLWHVIETCNIIFQVVDSRSPLFYYCDIRDILNNLDPGKQMVLLLNKADLLTRKQRFEWCKFFTNFDVTVIFWSARLEDSKESIHENYKKLEDTGTENDTESSLTIDTDNSWENFHSDEQDEKEYDYKIYSVDDLIKKIRKLSNGEEMIKVGFIGFPNVGKSSTMNKLLGKKKNAVSATPGKTKHFQSFYLDNDIEILDCPGLVFPTDITAYHELILSGILPVNEICDILPTVVHICEKIPRFVLEGIYRMIIPTTKLKSSCDTKFCSSEELLAAYAYSRNLKTGYMGVNTAEAAKQIIKDYINGKIIYVEAPPSLTLESPFNTFEYVENFVKTDIERKETEEKIVENSDLINVNQLEHKTKQLYFDKKYCHDFNQAAVKSNRCNYKTNKIKVQRGKLRRKYKNNSEIPYDI